MNRSQSLQYYIFQVPCSITEDNLSDAPETSCASSAPVGHPHYADLSDLHKYGHNRSPILYPLRRDQKQSATWSKRLQGNFEIPDTCIPKYESDRCCKHGNKFTENEQLFGVRSKGLIIYTNFGDRVFPDVTVYYRPTVGNCR